MIIDVNAYLGHYPFMQLRYNTAEKLLALMDRNGIDKALVSSLHAAFYRDAQRGNEELAEAVTTDPRRLIPLATINPKYAGWEYDFEQCLQEWKMKAVTLTPEHHGYRLTDGSGRAVLARIERAGLPLALTQRFEDRRQRHHWDQAEDLDFGEVEQVARQFPNLRILFVHWLGLEGRRLIQAGLKGRCLLEIARPHVLNRRHIPELIEQIGVEAVAFGSHMPFNYVGPALIKLAYLQEMLSPDEYERVAWRNAADFLAL